ncbi:MAG TPA: VOC family protein [Gallionella sp.]|nr:VOC family protein [Gallionella sp.]
MKITEIAFTGMPVTDIKQSRAFYEDILGLKPTLETLGGMLVEYGLGNGTFTIGCLGAAFKPSSDGSFIALEVEDLDSGIARLEAMGVKFAIGITELPTSRFAMILDPDGNKVMLHKRKA